MEDDKRKSERLRKRKIRSFLKEVDADIQEVLRERKKIPKTHALLNDQERANNDSEEHFVHSYEKSQEVEQPTDININDTAESSTVSKPHVIQRLRQWAIVSNINHRNLSSLLVILKDTLLPDLPTTAKSFLETAKASYDIEEMDDALSSEPGQFVYFGVAQGLEKCLADFHEGDISLVINIDGLPLSKSGWNKFWPILCKVFYKPDIYKPFVVAIYHGASKPKNINEYFARFIDEINELQQVGYIKNGNTFNVCVKAVVADTPARAFCKGTKGHGGYSACERCTIHGIGIKKITQKFTSRGQVKVHSTKIVYPGIGYIKRTNESFRGRFDPDHHTGISPLENILPEIDIIALFPLDFMHLACGGVTKRLLELITSGPLRVRLGARSRRELSRRMIFLRTQTPEEFQRKPQSIHYLAKWKATEFRFFLLYCGPIVLRKLLPSKLYKHFLLLCTSFRILCSEQFVILYKDKARKYLETFVSTLPLLYGDESQVINMHNLQHIVDDVENLGCDLSKINCFPFESFLGTMKKYLRSFNRPLEQYCRRQHERDLISLNPTEAPVQFKIISRSVKEGKIFVKSIIFNSFFFITTSTPNNVVLLSDGYIIEIKQIYGDSESQESLYIEGKVSKKKVNMYSYPRKSSSIGVWTIPEQTLKDAVYSLTSIEQKLVLLRMSLEPNGTLNTYALSLLHV